MSQEPFVPQIRPDTAKALIVLSFLFFAAAVVALLWRKQKKRMIPFEVRLAVFLPLLLLSTMFLRMIVGLSGYFEYGKLSVAEESANSFIHAMQSFVLSENYSEYIMGGKQVFAALFGDRAASMYVIYVSVINVFCAISGGAVLYNIIIRLFPQVRLFLAFLCFWKPICCFSEMNPESLALAKSIREKGGNLKHATLIFCNTDPSENGALSDHAKQAREINALQTRIKLNELHLFAIRKGKTFFLTGSDEDNLAVLGGFADDDCAIRFRSVDAIYVFANDKYGTLIEDAVRDKINGKLKKRRPDANDPENKITLFSVSRYRTIVYNLLQDKPLFSALSDESKELRVAIFGFGSLGTEAFLAAYWCGQMLDRKLKITVVSAEREEYFRKKIDHINGDILKTSAQHADQALLRVYPNGEQCAESYFSYEYVQSNVNLSGSDPVLGMQQVDSPDVTLADFDYFVVALGSDQKNMEVAEQIGRVVSAGKSVKRLKRTDGILCEARRAAFKRSAKWMKRRAKPLGTFVRRIKKTPILCAVWNDDLAASLKKANAAGLCGVEIIPFGSMESTYDIDKILFSKIAERAKMVNDLYEGRNARELYQGAIADKIGKKTKFEEDPYTYWANVTKAIYAQYKAEYLKLAADKERRIMNYLKLSALISLVVSVRDAVGNSKNYTTDSDRNDLRVADLLKDGKNDVRTELADKYERILKREKPAELIGNAAPDRDALIRYVGELADACETSLRAFLDGTCSAADVISAVSVPERPQCLHRLAWLEHRRWNAFMRAEGFRRPNEDEELAYIRPLSPDPPGPNGNGGKHKSIPLKLHPCIVECDDKGEKRDLFLREENDPDVDMLDAVSLRFRRKKEYASKDLRTSDFKTYDYLDYE